MISPIRNPVVDQTTNIDRIGYADSKYTFFIKLILFTIFNPFLSSHI
jgi:hypothetical protein